MFSIIYHMFSKGLSGILKKSNKVFNMSTLYSVPC